MLDLAVEIFNAEKKIGMVALKVKDVTGPHIHVPYLGSVWEIPNFKIVIKVCSLQSSCASWVGLMNNSDDGIDADLTTRVLPCRI